MKNQLLNLESLNKINCAGYDTLVGIFTPHMSQRMAEHLVNKFFGECERDLLKWLNSLDDSNYEILMAVYGISEGVVA